ncbi:MAG: tRNA (adenosine(37)-N6)-threonylcarbamoyltransferase complex dimerization subunit type 1 TsaB [Acholeplasmatales bacterium]|jgi:tRNA threonylcarbamoyl adenosine modification protein YeaZ|nr:tRNA (adenosine(37)-N6)-threonylcarbamoyltransferase complex dimerization subunit type 1 TsaB [Acholeplasmatales bacterium]
MNRLFLDTSNNFSYIALTKDNNLIDFFVRVQKNDLAAYFTNDINNLLVKNNLTVKDIEGIIVGVGPGSYTGLRIAITNAKMLAYFLNIKLFTVSSLFLLTSGYDKVLAYEDARNNNYFIGVYEKNKTIVKDGFYNINFLSAKNYQKVLISDETYKVDVKKVIKKAKENDNFILLEPSYLRETEAQRNLSNSSVRCCIRKTIVLDYNQIIDIEKESFGNDVNYIDSYFDNNKNILQAFSFIENGILKGYILYSVNNDTAWIVSIAVKNEYKCAGIGTKLINKIKIRKNINSIGLDVRFDNLNAIGFYTKNGFKYFKTVASYYQNPVCDSRVFIWEKKI